MTETHTQIMTCDLPSSCQLIPESGPCYAAIPKYYYDQEEKKCKEYTWGGCGEFIFDTLEECQICECNH